MANTYSNFFYHIVFSTKGRKNLIDPDIEERVWAYIGGIARKHEIIAVHFGGHRESHSYSDTGKAKDRSEPASDHKQ